jgi:hypothetical protein
MSLFYDGIEALRAPPPHSREAARRPPRAKASKWKPLRVDTRQSGKQCYGDEFAEHRAMIERGIVEAFEDLEAARRRFNSAARYLNQRIEEDPYCEWPALWNAFLADGGVTPDELSCWLTNPKTIRPTTVRKHLRLVASGGRPQRRLRPASRGGPPEAA